MNSLGTPHHFRESGDEIDLAQLLRHLWRGRWLIAAFTGIAVLVVLACYGAAYLAPGMKSEHAIVVQFSFPDADSGKYPNGERFTVSDVVGNDVLAAVHAALALDSYGLTQTQFAASVSIKPYAIKEDFIRERYKTRLEQKGLAGAEIEALETAYSKDLQQNAARFARIAISLPRNSPVPPSVVEHALNAIPRTWSELAIRQRGVLDVVPLSAAGLRTDDLQDVEYAIALQRLKEYGNYMKQGLRVMVEDSALRVISEPQTGLLPRDLDARIHEFLEYRVLPLYSEVMARGHVKNRLQTELYFRSAVQNLRDDRDEILRKAELYSAAIRGLDGGGQSQIASSNGSENVMASGSEYIDRMLEIGSRLSEADYRQRLTSQQLEYLVAAEQYTTRINELERQLELLKVKRVGTVDDVADRMATVFEEFEWLKNVYASLASASRVAALGKTGSLYRSLTPHPEIQDEWTGNLQRLLLLVFVGMFVGAALGTALYMVLALVRSPAQRLGHESGRFLETVPSGSVAVPDRKSLAP